MTENIVWAHYLSSSPGQSPGRAIVLPPALASALAAVLAKCLSFYVKVFYVWARRCQASYPVPVTGLVLFAFQLVLSQTTGISKLIFWEEKTYFEKSVV